MSKTLGERGSPKSASPSPSGETAPLDAGDVSRLAEFPLKSNLNFIRSKCLVVASLWSLCPSFAIAAHYVSQKAIPHTKPPAQVSDEQDGCRPRQQHEQ